jgi:hypothetical protein
MVGAGCTNGIGGCAVALMVCRPDVWSSHPAAESSTAAPQTWKILFMP